jgi:hypothetical protein
VTRSLVIAAVLLPFAIAAQPPVVVQDGGTPPPADEIGNLSVGTICEGPSGELWMICDPPGQLDGDASHIPYGVREQPRRQYRTVHVSIPNYGDYDVLYPGPAYVVNLREGTLFLVPVDTFVRPVTAARITFRPGQPLPEPPEP